jgi:hypothetical protein
MKKLVLIIFVISVVVASIITFNLITTKETFNFSLRYNVDGKDFISTFDEQLTVDTVHGIKVIDFKLKNSDLNKIKNKMIELDIFEGDFTKLRRSGVTLSVNGIYELGFEYNGVTRSIYWTTGNTNPVIIVDDLENVSEEDRYKGEYGQVNKLFDLKTFILEIIKEYDEYKALPPHKMYL